MWYPWCWTALLSAALFTTPSIAEDAQEQHTTVPIFLPYYENKSWSLMRGSILTSNADETTYTIFCAPQTPPTPPNCNMALEFPFVFAEGDNTLRFHGTKTSSYTADLECELEGKTAATCSAYSSFGPGVTVGKHTGPTEVSWTSTLTGSEVAWGVLTLTEEPTTTDSLEDISHTPMVSLDPQFSEDLLYDGILPTGTAAFPAETDSGCIRTTTSWVFAASIGGVLITLVLS